MKSNASNKLRSLVVVCDHPSSLSLSISESSKDLDLALTGGLWKGHQSRLDRYQGQANFNFWNPLPKMCGIYGKSVFQCSVINTAKTSWACLSCCPVSFKKYKGCHLLDCLCMCFRYLTGLDLLLHLWLESWTSWNLKSQNKHQSH